MWEEGFTEWYQSMVQPLDWMGCVWVMLLLIAYVFHIPMCMCLLHPCCVGHGASGVSMGVSMMLFSTEFHVCMNDYALFMFV